LVAKENKSGPRTERGSAETGRRGRKRKIKKSSGQIWKIEKKCLSLQSLTETAAENTEIGNKKKALILRKRQK
jgi:hypothetical protein